MSPEELVRLGRGNGYIRDEQAERDAELGRKVRWATACVTNNPVEWWTVQAYLAGHFGRQDALDVLKTIAAALEEKETTP